MNVTDPAPERPSRALYAALIYFALVFVVGLILGPARVLWLEPWLGRAIAVLLEAPFLVCAMWFAAPLSLRWGRVELGWARALWVGVLALVLQQVADLAVGFGLRGMTLTDQLTYFATPAGAIYAFTLVVFAIMPLMRMRRAEKTT
ncbi:hypothetical protein [Candidatus Viadribacter manganicus]|uniref:Uncharacterized protein n=1 Tax=Candidatus Viadribacter manganicus TaxID=1759059 RepID=A0A1B1AJN4_9PROT|nr:hypothetical protein [Candidatus Viadribacter manganicus]ANP46778.1 hypothetical protein ATE48_13090 [Candidatus Viadribacter manganicus]